MGERPPSLSGWSQLGVDLVLDKMSRLAVQCPRPCVLEDCVLLPEAQLGGGRRRESIDPHALKTSGGRKLGLKPASQWV